MVPVVHAVRTGTSEHVKARPTSANTVNEVRDLQTQESLDRLATACERLLVIVIVIAALLGVFIIGFVVRKVQSNHSGRPKMKQEGPTATTAGRSDGNDIRH